MLQRAKVRAVQSIGQTVWKYLELFPVSVQQDMKMIGMSRDKY